MDDSALVQRAIQSAGVMTEHFVDMAHLKALVDELVTTLQLTRDKLGDIDRRLHRVETKNARTKGVTCTRKN